MTTTCIPYTHVPHASALLTDYLYHFDRVSHFYNGSPYDPRSYRAVADQVTKLAFGRADITEILTRQNQAFGCSEPTLANIHRLSQPGTFAVVTGQQVGLFSGPAFTVYKALTTVRLAQSLTERDTLAFRCSGWPPRTTTWRKSRTRQSSMTSTTWQPAPRFWRPSFTALARGRSPSHGRGFRGAWPNGSGPAGGRATFPTLKGSAGVLRARRTWGTSFAKFLTRLFGRWGVILIDPLDESVRRLRLWGLSAGSGKGGGTSCWCFGKLPRIGAARVSRASSRGGRLNADLCGQEWR